MPRDVDGLVMPRQVVDRIRAQIDSLELLPESDRELELNRVYMINPVLSALIRGVLIDRAERRDGLDSAG